MNIVHAQNYNRQNAADAKPDSEIFAHLVDAFQDANGLPRDGMFGKVTREKLAADYHAEPPVSGPAIQLVDWIPGLKPDDVEGRWASMSKLAIEYVLGAGGRDPNANDPRSEKNGKLGLDCTGADAYASALSRLQPHFPYYGGWINTDSIVADARGNQVLFELLDRPVRGCGLVFAGIDFDHDGDRERIGHKSWVSRVLAGFNPKKPDYRLVEIWDCAGSNSKLVPGAVGDVAKHVAGYFNGKDTFRDVTKAEWATIAVWNKATGRPA